MDNETSDSKNWGGKRDDAGRIAVVKRKNYKAYLSEEENAIDKRLSMAFRQTENELNKEIAGLLKCKQYEVSESVYAHVLALREKIITFAVAEVEKEKDVIKKQILQEKQH